MNEVNSILTNYLNKCALIFDEKRSNRSNIIPLRKGSEIIARDNFNKVINEAESTIEFNDVVNSIKDCSIFKGQHVKAIRLATDRFFRNTGTYYLIWNNYKLKENLLMKIVKDSIEQKDYEIVHFFVFDGFELYDTKKNRNLLKEIKLPDGKIKILSQEEIEALFNIPENEWPNNLNID